METAFVFSCLALFFHVSHSIDNGLGVNPPMGWRSWNCYGGAIDQSLIEKVIDAMLDTSRQVDGINASYYDMGYTEVGVDDNWQYCLTDAKNHTYFHSDEAPFGYPIVNEAKFPDLASLIQYAHDRNVKIGWYFNNCICRENNAYPANEANDVKFLREYDFDGVKLDGCGTSTNVTNWQQLINDSSVKPMLTENCHNHPLYATQDWCPMNFFRSSGDIQKNYINIIGTNLQSVLPYSTWNESTPAITRPGCFAYPDMLQVGNIPAVLNATQYSMDRTHFGAWVVVSSPLIIGYDVTNDEITDRVWDILTNKEAIAVSQTWAGYPGTLLKEGTDKIYYEYPRDIREKIKRDNAKYEHVEAVRKEPIDGATLSGYQIWGKPQLNECWAVLLMNNDGYKAQDVTVEFTDVPGLATSGIKVRSIWDKQDIGTYDTSYTAQGVLPFDSAFLMLCPTA